MQTDCWVRHSRAWTWMWMKSISLNSVLRRKPDWLPPSPPRCTMEQQVSQSRFPGCRDCQACFRKKKEKEREVLVTKKEDAMCVHLLKINLLSPNLIQEDRRKTLQEKYSPNISDFPVLRISQKPSFLLN